jgi:hypothetical protein
MNERPVEGLGRLVVVPHERSPAHWNWRSPAIPELIRKDKVLGLDGQLRSVTRREGNNRGARMGCGTRPQYNAGTNGVMERRRRRNRAPKKNEHILSRVRSLTRCCAGPQSGTSGTSQ